MNQLFLKPELTQFPVELIKLPRWVAWRAEGSPGEKPRKVPYSPRQPNRRASSTNANTWGTFDEAKSAYEKYGHTGIGFVLNADGIVGVDIDHCVENGTPRQEAMDLLAGLGAGHIELSPSGTGLRAFGYATSLKKGVKGKLNGLDVELYSTSRYLTLTGQCLKQGPLTALKGFGDLAKKLGTNQTVQATREDLQIGQEGKIEGLIGRVLSGDIYHDSLRDLAASMIAHGMKLTAVISYLQGLMKNTSRPKDDRWNARFQQIPDLVASAAKKYSPNLGVSSYQSQVTGDPNRYQLLDGVALSALPPLQWRVKGVLPEHGLAAIYGPSGSGKSFLGFDLAAAISEGVDWFNHRVKQSNVVYAALEGEAGFKLRAQAWAADHARPLPPALQMLLQPFRLTTPQDVADLAAAVPRGSVVFIDTLNRAAPVADENSSKDMGEILEAAKLLKEEIDGLVVLVHHTGKDTSKGARGHSSLFAALDAALEVSRRENERSWKVAKSKDGEDGKMHSFTLCPKELGKDDYGDPISSCVVIANGVVSKVRTPNLSPRTKIALKALEDAIDTQGTTPPKELIERWSVQDRGIDAAVIKVVTEDQWRAASYSAGITEANAEQDSKRKAFSRARLQLLDSKRINVYSGFVGIT